MTCREIRNALVQGSEPTEAARTHASSCSACAVVLADHARLGRQLAAHVAGSAPHDPSALFSAVASEVANERGLRAYLRSRPTWQRRALVCVSGLPLVVLLLAVAGARNDVHALGAGWFAAEILLLTALAVWCVVHALEPLHVAGRSRWRTVVLGAAIALIGIASVLFLGADPTSWTAETSGPGAAEARCFATGTVIALPLGLAGWFLGRRRSLPRALLLASAAGVSGMLALHVHCPSRDALHLGFGHASVVVACWTVVLLGSRLRAAWSRGEP